MNYLPITNLDFDGIKTAIIERFKNDPTFTDYNFEGSALNTLIDILAYNTHTNAYYASMLHNESYIDTAQKRSSVVSLAKMLGYTPKSASGATAIINITVNSVTNDTQYTLLKRGTSFSSSNEAGTHSFVTVGDYFGSYTKPVGQPGYVTFNEVTVKCGVMNRNNYTYNDAINSRGLFKIPNKNVDISTLKIYIKTDAKATIKSEYINSNSIYNINHDSKVYYVQESYDGNYEFYFGQNIVGKQPENGNVIEVEYLVVDTNKDSSNCRIFSYSGGFTTSNLSITTVQQSYGNTSKEEIDSIRLNSVKNYSSKNRAVTVDDYSSLLLSNFPFIKNVSVWGGEDNIPAVYGKVFISIQPILGYILTESYKDTYIIPFLKKFNMLTIKPELIDPSYVIMKFNTKIKFDRYKSTKSETEIIALAKNSIVSYVNDISTYNSKYYNSSLINKLTQIDAGVVSVSISKQIGFTINPIPNVATSYSYNLFNQITPGTITSNEFSINYLDIFYPNVSITEYGPNNSVTRDLYLKTSDGRIITRVGTVSYGTGQFTLLITIASYINSIPVINIMCKTAEDDVTTRNNQILALESSVNTYSDYTDNLVTVEQNA